VIWLEGSPRLEESLYWLQLLLDTEVPVVGHVALRTHGMLSNDGDRNILNGVEYIVSGEGEGLGAVAIQDQLVYPAREFKKGDARPGSFRTVGGLGGPLGSVKEEVRIQFAPNYNHTASSDVNVSTLPEELSFRDVAGDDETTIRVKDEDGLVGSEIPRVSIVKGSAYPQVQREPDAEQAVDIVARTEQALAERAEDSAPNLHGLVYEGTSPYGTATVAQDEALHEALYSGIPVVRVGRSDPSGFLQPPEGLPTIDGSNLDTNKAVLLLTAALLKLGRLPRAADPADPTDAEREAVRETVSEFQHLFENQ